MLHQWSNGSNEALHVVDNLVPRPGKLCPTFMSWIGVQKAIMHAAYHRPSHEHPKPFFFMNQVSSHYSLLESQHFVACVHVVSLSISFHSFANLVLVSTTSSLSLLLTGLELHSLSHILLLALESTFQVIFSY